MKIILAGGSGFIGQYLFNKFTKEGHTVFVLTRNPKQEHDIQWDGKTLGNWVKQLEDSDVLINLAGRSVDCRYTEKNKAQILSSRVDSTKILGKALETLNSPPKIWINSGTATIYKYSLDKAMDEENGEIGEGFSVNVAKEWEKAFYDSYSKDIRKVVMRISIILGSDGGAIRPLGLLAKMGLGGKQGSGNQMFSWLHIEDLHLSIKYIIENKNIVGAVNFAAPNPINNKKLMASLRKHNNRSFGLPTPSWLLKIGAFIIQTELELILKSRYVIPTKLLKSGYQFKFDTIDKALGHIYKN